MPFTIPNEADAGNSNQAEPDSVDFDILTYGAGATGVFTGCAVTAQGTPDMTVAVAAGSVSINDVGYLVTAGNGTITAADGTNPRFDLVTINTSGTIVVTAGTAAASPVFPAHPADVVVLAAVYVAASDTAIQSGEIVDKRVMLNRRALDTTYIYASGVDIGDAQIFTDSAIGIQIDNNYPTYSRFTVQEVVTIDQVSYELFTAGGAGSLYRIGLFDSDSLRLPGNILWDSGALAGDAATGVKTIVLSRTFYPGVVYWVVVGTDASIKFTGMPNSRTVMATAQYGSNAFAISRSSWTFGAFTDNPFSASTATPTNKGIHTWWRVA